MDDAKILVADDNPVVLLSVTKILEKSGYDVLSAVDGKQGLDLALKENVDLIISDKKMPEMDGIEFCKAIKENEQTKDIYFMIHSIIDSSESKTEGLNIGVDDYLSKEIASEELLARVAAGLRVRGLMKQLKEANLSLLQSEKLASIGQLAAGIAHEINNPIGFITSNLRTLKDYSSDLTRYVSEQEDFIKEKCSEKNTSLAELRQMLDIDYITEDIDNLIGESLEGSDRVKKIILDLKNFARVEKSEKHDASIEQMLESTLNIIWNELKYKAEIVKQYSDEELIVNCNNQEINQVFMNILINASQAIEERGKITIKTWLEKSFVNIAISDTGCGIPNENIIKLFEPFFTTKPVGEGTGLGLSIIYDIVKKHGGDITVESKAGEGATFTVQLPMSGKG